MLNPFGPQQESGSYMDLQKRMLQRVQETKVNDRIFDAVQKSFEDALRAENIVLGLPERKRMLSQILRSVLENMIKKLDKR